MGAQVTRDTLTPRLERLRGAGARVAAALRPAAQDVLAAVEPNVPVDTGRLKRTGRVLVLPDGAAVAYGGPDAPYAAIVERRQGWMAGGAMQTASGRARRVQEAMR